MSATDLYRKQHKDILEIGGRLAALLDEAKLKLDAAPARKALSELGGKVKVHLAMEDKSLYPLLSASKAPATVATARAFVASMGGLVQAFLAYDKKYALAKEIQAHPADFIKESKFVMGALGERIKKEEAELYALADQEGL